MVVLVYLVLIKKEAEEKKIEDSHDLIWCGFVIEDLVTLSHLHRQTRKKKERARRESCVGWERTFERADSVAMHNKRAISSRRVVIVHVRIGTPEDEPVSVSITFLVYQLAKTIQRGISCNRRKVSHTSFLLLLFQPRRRQFALIPDRIIACLAFHSAFLIFTLDRGISIAFHSAPLCALDVMNVSILC